MRHSEPIRQEDCLHSVHAPVIEALPNRYSDLGNNWSHSSVRRQPLSLQKLRHPRTRSLTRRTTCFRKKRSLRSRTHLRCSRPITKRPLPKVASRDSSALLLRRRLRASNLCGHQSKMPPPCGIPMQPTTDEHLRLACPHPPIVPLLVAGQIISAG